MSRSDDRARRYEQAFTRASAERRPALMPFLPVGYPSLEATVPLCDALVEAGADMLELGLPFSDPVADGPVLQAAAEVALRNGATMPRCLETLAEVRRRNPEVPIAVLTYANLVETPGAGAFFARLAEAGVDGAVIADLPTRECRPYAAFAEEARVCLIRLAAPNTPAAVLDEVAGLGSGFTYVVARRGVTGADKARSSSTGLPVEVISGLKERGAAPPVVGFGISRAEQVAAVTEAGAAGAIVGSALVDALGRGTTDAESIQIAREFLAGLWAAPARAGAPC